MRCLVVALVLLAVAYARRGHRHSVATSGRKTAPRSKSSDKDASNSRRSRLKDLADRLQISDVETVDERANVLSLEVFRNETLLGAKTMLRYHHVLMTTSFISRLIFSLCLRLLPRKLIYYAMLGLGKIADVSMKINIFHKLATWGRFLLYCILEILGGRMRFKNFHEIYADFCQQGGFVQGNFIYPIMEELTFRGCAQGFLHAILSKSGVCSRYATLVSQLFAASFFSMAHSAAVADLGTFALLAQRTIGSFCTSLLMLGPLAQRRCVWTSIGAHVLWNVFADWPTTQALTSIGIDALASPIGGVPKQLLRFISYLVLHMLSLNIFRAFFGMDPIEQVSIGKAKRTLVSIFKHLR